jgi:hypothetical protein
MKYLPSADVEGLRHYMNVLPRRKAFTHWCGLSDMDKILTANVKTHDGFGKTVEQKLCHSGKSGFYQRSVFAIGQGQTKPHR